jgi:transposase-like protein
MGSLTYRRHRFPASIIQHAVWLYLRFTLSYRDVEELLAERGIDVSYETVRRWVLKFGPLIARRLRQRRPQPSKRWHLDEMVVRIASRRMYLWRAVDDEGEILEMLVQRRRDTRAALRLMRKLLKKQGFAPKLLVTDKLRSYSSASLQSIRLVVGRCLQPRPARTPQAGIARPIQTPAAAIVRPIAIGCAARQTILPPLTATETRDASAKRFASRSLIRANNANTPTLR